MMYQPGLNVPDEIYQIKCTRYSLDKMNLRLPLSSRCDERHILGGPPTYPLCDTNSHHLRDRDRYLVKKNGRYALIRGHQMRQKLCLIGKIRYWDPALGPRYVKQAPLSFFVRFVAFLAPRGDPISICSVEKHLKDCLNILKPEHTYSQMY